MNIFKKSIASLVAFGVLLFCTACTNEAQYPKSTASAEEWSCTPTEQEKDIPDGHAGIYTAEAMHFSGEDIERFLSCCADALMDSRKEVFDTTTSYAGVCQSGKEFLYLESTGYHPHTVFQYIDQDKYNLYYAYPIYSGEESYETNVQYSIGRMFTEVKDFSFATAKDAEESVRLALSALGISDLSLLRTLYIDHNTMAEAGKKLATDPAYAPVGEPQENNGYPLRDDWSETDDAYMFSFGISVGNAVLSPRFEIRETATYIGTQIIVWYSANGIDFLSVDMPWKVGKLVQEPKRIVSAEAAAEVVREKLGSILNYHDIIYSDAVLEYQYQQEKQSWFLYPVWTVKVSYRTNNSPVLYDYISVDAFTGMEI